MHSRMLLLLVFHLSIAVNALTNDIRRLELNKFEKRIGEINVPVPKKSPKLLDLLKALSDTPKGSYVALMRPVVMAAALAYNTTDPKLEFGADDTTQAQSVHVTQIANFRRDYRLELNPPNFGIHARVFVKDDEQRIIVSIRGSCQDFTLRQCRADNCYLARADNFGYLTEDVIQQWSGKCTEFNEKELDYLSQSRNLVDKIQGTYPHYAVLLTGHSMGGNLAILTAAQQPDKLQALAISPSPFHRIMIYELKFTSDRIKLLPKENLISFGDAYDLGINTVLVSDAREGSITCVLHPEGKTPPPCEKLDLDMSAGASLTSMLEWTTTAMCKNAVHSVHRYSDLLNDPFPIMPVCDKELSTLAGWNIRVDFGSAGFNMFPGGKSFGERVNELFHGPTTGGDAISPMISNVMNGSIAGGWQISFPPEG